MLTSHIKERLPESLVSLLSFILMEDKTNLNNKDKETILLNNKVIHKETILLNNKAIHRETILNLNNKATQLKDKSCILHSKVVIKDKACILHSKVVIKDKACILHSNRECIPNSNKACIHHSKDLVQALIPNNNRDIQLRECILNSKEDTQHNNIPNKDKIIKELISHIRVAKATKSMVRVKLVILIKLKESIELTVNCIYIDDIFQRCFGKGVYMKGHKSKPCKACLLARGLCEKCGGTGYNKKKGKACKCSKYK